MKFAATILSLLVAVMASAVQPFPGGVRIAWEKVTNDVSFFVWRLNPGTTNWMYLGSTIATNYIYTNSFPEGTMFGVTANQRSNGFCCVASDVGVAGWPPAIDTPQKTVRLIPTNGFLVTTGKWIKVSSDLKTFDDWIRFSNLAGGGPTNSIRVEHMVSPLKPYLFMAYPTNPTPPFP